MYARRPLTTAGFETVGLGGMAGSCRQPFHRWDDVLDVRVGDGGLPRLVAEVARQGVSPLPTPVRRRVPAGRDRSCSA